GREQGAGALRVPRLIRLTGALGRGRPRIVRWSRRAWSHDLAHGPLRGLLDRRVAAVRVGATAGEEGAGKQSERGVEFRLAGVLAHFKSHVSAFSSPAGDSVVTESASGIRLTFSEIFLAPTELVRAHRHAGDPRDCPTRPGSSRATRATNMHP